jgi:hypothetical protein
MFGNSEAHFFAQPGVDRGEQAKVDIGYVAAGGADQMAMLVVASIVSEFV